MFFFFVKELYMKNFNKIIILGLLIIISISLLRNKEGFCFVPLDMGICAEPGSIEGDRCQALCPIIVPGVSGPVYDLSPAAGPPPWHDVELPGWAEAGRIPSDPRPSDFGPKVPEKGSYGKKQNDAAGADGHDELMAVGPGHKKSAHQHTPPNESKNSYNVG